VRGDVIFLFLEYLIKMYVDINKENNNNNNETPLHKLCVYKSV